MGACLLSLTEKKRTAEKVSDGRGSLFFFWSEDADLTSSTSLPSQVNTFHIETTGFLTCKYISQIDTDSISHVGMSKAVTAYSRTQH